MFQDKVDQVNSLLASQGKAIVQRKQVDGQPALYGYKPQPLIDAVNKVFGIENWYYKLHEIEVIPFSDDGTSGQVIAKVEVFMRAKKDEEFFSHGIQYGQAGIVHKNVGDATKGSITDALGKGFSLFSLGAKAYRGELEAVYNGVNPDLPVAESPQEQNPDTAESEEIETDDFPNLPNVEYEHDGNGLVLAKGDTYRNRYLLKRLGFQWKPDQKAWGIQRLAA
jgi:hypothetical protein